ncbi:Stk1 family PASTA domain-containing Ser/Thr kinase [Bacillus litorisediminis]|uniref:Stk1 family PASTA domain-containing Ser/Thr kinase n=1 Tax=Bacillus litorisediminis TaxID=2922713 RepID=UPI001FAE1770|nr:Stk1 family PASTA domain-containing Ser/Thr kinase [Bacillus litorisediminis]
MIIGRRISGRYKIIEMIGGGGMANVYLAHDMILDRDVAIKILRMDFSDNENFIRRFHREAQSATSLAHPNIVSIYDVGEEDDIYYIVMEYVEGMTLKQYIQQHSPISVHKVIEIMEQLASAIAHAHQNNIVHRDIKPQNILIDKHDVVKITDFGIAMAISATAITHTNTVLGTVHYLSPEQARGGMANKKSDIYSLGIVMFELLTGRLPFSGESAVSIALKHLQSETPSVKRWNPNIPQSVENIVLKATAKDPFHRYASAEELEEDLKTALDPDRMNEKPFVVPKDEEATKAIPVFTNEKPFNNMDETILRDDKKTQSPKPEQAKKKKKWPLILGITLFFLLVGGILAYAILPGMLAPDLVEVPDVSEKTVNEAVNELVLAGLKKGEIVKIHDESIEEGLIVRTDPRAGTKVKEGSEITIYESMGKERYTLSDYVGKQIDSVKQMLEDEGFEDIEVIEEFSDQLEGTITDQEPAADEEVIPEETKLIFTVSKGPEKIELEDLTGYSQPEYTTYANTHQFIINVTGEEFHNDIPEGQVIRQDPKPGTMVEKGTTINVVLSKGKESIPPKEETVEVLIPYKVDDENQTNEPQLVQIYIEDMNHNITELAEEFEITKDTPYKITLLIPYGGKAVYQIRRDNEIIVEETREYPAE